MFLKEMHIVFISGEVVLDVLCSRESQVTIYLSAFPVSVH